MRADRRYRIELTRVTKRGYYSIPVEEDAWVSDDNYIVVATDGDAQFTGAVPFDEEFLGEVLRDAQG